MLAPWERKPVEPEPAEPILEDVLERLRSGRRGPLVPLAAGELADDDAPHTLELADLLEVEQGAVDSDWRIPHLLEEEDRALEIGLPRRADRVPKVDWPAVSTLAPRSPAEISVALPPESDTREGARTPPEARACANWPRGGSD